MGWGWAGAVFWGWKGCSSADRRCLTCLQRLGNTGWPLLSSTRLSFGIGCSERRSWICVRVRTVRTLVSIIVWPYGRSCWRGITLRGSVREGWSFLEIG